MVYRKVWEAHLMVKEKVLADGGEEGLWGGRGSCDGCLVQSGPSAALRAQFKNPVVGN
jgi:hypothetical protein